MTMESWTELIFPSLLALLLAILLSFFKGSSDSSDFIVEKIENYKKCGTEFRGFKDFLKEEQPLPGNLLECKRSMGIYDHWGIIVAQNYVIHLVPNGSGGTELKKDKLAYVVKESKCRINNLKRSALERGLNPRSRMEIVESAEDYLDKFVNGGLRDSKTFRYNLMNFNCEHFVTLCAFGEPFSEQADNAKDKPAIKVISNGIAKSVESSFEN